MNKNIIIVLRHLTKIDIIKFNIKSKNKNMREIHTFFAYPIKEGFIRSTQSHKVYCMLLLHFT